MTDSPTAVATKTDDDKGTVTMMVTWHGLAEFNGDLLTVAELFASEFPPDRELRVVAPDGYLIDEASPAPDENDGMPSPGRPVATFPGSP